MKEKFTQFAFYNELTDFLTPNSNPYESVYRFKGNPSIKDAIEAQGVPHTEVELIVVNGKSVNFSYQLEGGENIEVYPDFESVNMKEKIRLRGESPKKFILDVQLGKLARFIRLLGFDCLYKNDYDDPLIAELAHKLNRTVLTRDRRLLRYKKITHGYWVRAVDPKEQLEEIIKKFDLLSFLDPFNRCIVCNAPMIPIEKEKIIHKLEPKTKKYYNEFRHCINCDRIYWKGSHYEKMTNLIEQLNCKKRRLKTVE